MKTFSIGCLIFAACAGCPPRPDPIGPVPDAEITYTEAGLDAKPSPIDASTLTACDLMCRTLRELGCPEGSPDGAVCEVVCTHAQGSRLTDLHPSCVAAARSKAEVRACGSVRCL